MKYIFWILVVAGINMSGCGSNKNKNQISQKLDQMTTGENSYRGLSAVIVKDGSISHFNSGVDKINPDSVVEIASITKIFTSLLFAYAQSSNLVKLTDSVNSAFDENLLNDDINKSIQLIDLSKHRAGFPRLPHNLPSLDPLQPYQGFTLSLLKDYLKTVKFRQNIPNGYKLAHEINPKDLSDVFGDKIRKSREVFIYSNIGACILGHSVANVLGLEYTQSIRAYITKPLKMDDTVFSLNTEQNQRKIKGYGIDNAPVTGWARIASNPSGGLVSTPQDMGIFLSEFLSQSSKSGTLFNAMELTLTELSELKTSQGKIKVALGWMVGKNDKGDLVYWHNGGSNGFLSFIAINPTKNSGVFLVGNGMKFISNQIDNRIDKTGFDILSTL